jgi:HrpA-like RNA helicase
MSGEAPQRKRKIDLSDMTDQGPSRKVAKTEETTTQSGASESTTNPWNGQAYSAQYYKILETRKTLPVWEQREQFYDYLKNNQVIVLQGETGSGKTTQVRIYSDSIPTHGLLVCFASLHQATALAPTSFPPRLRATFFFLSFFS